MITVKELADRWCLSTKKIYDLVARGDLDCYRFGSAIRFDDDQVERYLARIRSGIEKRTRLWS